MMASREIMMSENTTDEPTPPSRSVHLLLEQSKRLRAEADKLEEQAKAIAEAIRASKDENQGDKK
jgi:hypothetical protein